MNSQETQPLTNNIGRVFRGGSWSSSARYCCSAYRIRYLPVNRYGYLGFRVIKKSQQGNPVIRGGSWLSRQARARSDYRFGASRPDGWYDNFGFRVIKQRNTQ